ncbi:MAG: hypothetical protein LKI39_09170 [Bacteroides sp.]|jgi:hypothetical protein|nr:hypothetical protein [Bacteroides sp.]MCI1682712.1 hypothetical protein [Bacteroides sp.]
MKQKYYILLVVVSFLATSCDPIEDLSLREKFEKTGSPITQAELDAAISITQPIDGQDYKVVIQNSRTDVPGAWHVQTSVGEKIIGTDRDTIVYDKNKKYEIYYTGLSEKQTVTSSVFTVSVSDLPVDEYETFICGAVQGNAAGAKKTWTFQRAEKAVCYNGMLAQWQYSKPFTPGTGQWGSVDLTDIQDQTMTFEFNDSKLTTYDKDGNVMGTGQWASNHNGTNNNQVAGELYTTTAIIGSSLAWQSFTKDKPYWILRISNDEMVLIRPSLYIIPEEPWDYDASYYFLKPKE